jgi:phosphoribosylamine---glycine ligase
VGEASIHGSCNEIELQWSPEAAVCVVIASGGYPGTFEAGKKIAGLEQASALQGVKVFHAATSKRDDVYFTSGGRVLGVTARATDLERAVDRAYEGVSKIGFEGMHYRKDIAGRALKK